MALFKKSLAKTPQTTTQVYNFDTLSAKPKSKTVSAVKQGVFNFIPLFHVLKDGEGLSENDIREGVFEWFKYQCRLKGDEAGKPVKYVTIKWINSNLQAGVDGGRLSDPGYMLDLHLPAKQKKFIPGFGVPGGTFEDTTLYNNVRIPALVNFELNKAKNVVPGTGEVVLIEMNEKKLNAIIQVMKDIENPSYYYKDDSGAKAEEFDYEGFGYGYVISLDKDTTRDEMSKYYIFKRKDNTVHPDHIRENLETAARIFEEYKDSEIKYGAPYKKYIDAAIEGELEETVAEELVIATIAETFLKNVGETYIEDPKKVIETFNQVHKKYRLGLTANSSNSVIASETITLSPPKRVKKVEVEEPEGNEVDADSEDKVIPF